MRAPRGVVFIQSDQHRADCLNCSGHPLLRTPNLNRLAAEGLRFTHAYTAIPVCVPARTSMMTGRWSFRHGVLANWDIAESQSQLEPSATTWSSLLQRRGIAAEYIGRWHVSRDHDPTAFGFRHYQSDAGYAAWRAAHGLHPAPTGHGYFGEGDPFITPEQSSLSWLFDRALERLDILAHEEAPFFLRIDTLEPHLPNRICEPYASLYPPATIPRWGSFGETFKDKPYVQLQQLRTWGIEDWTWDDWAPVVGRYLGEIELLDHQIGRVLAALDRLGLADDVLVVYTSDHGDMCGSHRMLDKHYVMYDDVVRVPLLVRWPSFIAPGSVADTFVSATLDLPATFVDLFTSDMPETFDGLSLSFVFANPQTRLRPDIFSAYHGNQMGLYSQRMVSNGKWKYIWNATAEDELYHLETDPFELRNCMRDSAATPAREHMKKRLLQLMEQHCDPLLNQWTRRGISTA